MEKGNQNQIQAVIFDFGNVIYQFDNYLILQGLSSLCGRSVGEFAALMGGSMLSTDYESGRIDSKRFLEGVSRLCGFPFEETIFIRVFVEIFTPIESTLALIRRLAPHYQLGLISNTNPWHFEYTIRPCEVFPLFDAVSVSHEVKVMKPDPRIYVDALNKLGLKAGACVFIDDRPEFVEAASRLGLHGITYSSHENLITELSALGVVV